MKGSTAPILSLAEFRILPPLVTRTHVSKKSTWVKGYSGKVEKLRYLEQLPTELQLISTPNYHLLF